MTLRGGIKTDVHRECGCPHAGFRKNSRHGLRQQPTVKFGIWYVPMYVAP